MNASFPRPAKPDYTNVFVEPAYSGGEPYGSDLDDEESGLASSGRPPSDVPEGR